MIGDVEETMTAKFIKDEIPKEFQKFIQNAYLKEKMIL